MKRKDFLRKMKDRRRGGAVEERQPDKRRQVDWRTLRVDLPDDGESEAETMPVGTLSRLPGGVRLNVTSACWVRGYRLYELDGSHKAEFQYRPAGQASEAPPGSIGLETGDTWEPDS